MENVGRTVLWLYMACICNLSAGAVILSARYELSLITYRADLRNLADNDYELTEDDAIASIHLGAV
jgi:hypothetical protein